MKNYQSYREGYVVGSWNVARALSHPTKYKQIADGIKTIDADVISIVEAFDKTGRPIDPAFAENLGYRVRTTEYEDDTPHPSVYQFMSVLVRKKLMADVDVIRLATRNAVEVRLPSGNKRLRTVFGHWDDRNSDLRRGMTDAFIDQLVPGEATLLATDLNNMHASDTVARILQSTPVRRLSRLMPESLRMGSLLRRSIDMADGAVLAQLEDSNFADADLDHMPTMKFMGTPIMQLDHMMYTRGLVSVADFTAYDLPGSDHRPISAIVSAA